MVAVRKRDTGVDVVVPANGSTMPDWARMQKLVFIMMKHIWSCNLEAIARKVIIYHR